MTLNVAGSKPLGDGELPEQNRPSEAGDGISRARQAMV